MKRADPQARFHHKDVALIFLRLSKCLEQSITDSLMAPVRRMECPLEQSILSGIARISSRQRDILGTTIILHYRASEWQTRHPTTSQPTLQDSADIVIGLASGVARPGRVGVGRYLAVKLVEGVPVEVVEPGGVVVDAGEDAAGIGLFDARFAEAMAVEEGRDAGER